ncbi:ABC transporter ATP-binding protein SaoA [Dehalobacterium formicoaceticum]|uniref:ABC transporter ATP-binding protein SaoA n=1 Tax=Dehalobacterium formicoaceticum TaxID=51515 RepID=A0ABT1Y6J1_9FIRM|nr:ABC transporter ATP-binding protein SaoA [Dehalobacterium formicoaceticum]MCR6546500.1 ABC transporter ATP-binding protein SaoA [Dehalobacterium formicoaceticum]
MSISVRGITKEFKNKREKNKSQLVLKDISFDVEEGEFVTLLGPSGCGKTTTLTIIAGFQKYNGGKILINGNVVNKPGPDRAFVFQNYALFPWMKVGENIMYPMKKRKIPKKDRINKLKELLEMAQLEGYENYFVHELSGGMKQRVALLRALACEPQVLLMDEPLGAVDFQMRKLLQMQLETILQKKNVTVLMVTHDVDEAIYLSDRVIIMSRDHGRLLGDIKVDLPRPRDRNCDMYHNYMSQLTEILKSALNGDVKNKEDEDLMDFIKKNEHKSDDATTRLDQSKKLENC